MTKEKYLLVTILVEIFRKIYMIKIRYIKYVFKKIKKFDILSNFLGKSFLKTKMDFIYSSSPLFNYDHSSHICYLVYNYLISIHKS
jgi:hypothetical protein